MLWMESNRIANLPQSLTQEAFDRQREIVINERRERVENEPYGNVNSLLHQHMFPPGHPYAHDTIGSPADLRAATLDDARSFFAGHYTAGNLSIAVAGDFDTPDAKRWIARYFGSMAPGQPSVGPPLPAPKSIDVKGYVPYPQYIFAWAGPRAADPDAAALDVIDFLLSEA